MPNSPNNFLDNNGSSNSSPRRNSAVEISTSDRRISINMPGHARGGFRIQIPSTRASSRAKRSVMTDSLKLYEEQILTHTPQGFRALGMTDGRRPLSLCIDLGSSGEEPYITDDSHPSSTSSTMSSFSSSSSSNSHLSGSASHLIGSNASSSPAKHLISSSGHEAHVYPSWDSECKTTSSIPSRPGASSTSGSSSYRSSLVTVIPAPGISSVATALIPLSVPSSAVVNLSTCSMNSQAPLESLDCSTTSSSDLTDVSSLDPDLARDSDEEDDDSELVYHEVDRLPRSESGDPHSQTTSEASLFRSGRVDEDSLEAAGALRAGSPPPWIGGLDDQDDRDDYPSTRDTYDFSTLDSDYLSWMRMSVREVRGSTGLTQVEGMPRSQVARCVSVFNDNNDQGLKMNFVDDTCRLNGSLRVYINLIKPVKMSLKQAIDRGLSSGPGGRKEACIPARMVSFFLPRGTSKVMPLTSSTTAMDLVETLLHKFHIQESPRKFALYEHTLEPENTILVRKFDNAETPVATMLSWARDGPELFDQLFTKKRVVLQENENWEINWNDFSQPELSTFLRILAKEEDEYRNAIITQYGLLRQDIERRMSELRASEDNSTDDDSLATEGRTRHSV